MDEFELIIGNRRFAGWESFSINRSIRSLSVGFTIEYSDKWIASDASWPVDIGDRAKISISGEMVLDGYIEKRRRSATPESRKLKVMGRDTTGDMIDCSLVIEPFTLKDVHLKKIIEIASKPFGIKKVDFRGDAGDKFSDISIQPGETAFEFIDRYAKPRGLLFYSDGNGTIIVTKPGTEYSEAALVEGENIKTLTDTGDETERFSSYTVKGQTNAVDWFAGEKAAHSEGKAEDRIFVKDDGISRERPLVIIAETAATSPDAKIRAQWEASIRLARSYTATITVAGWRQKPKGKLWGINKLVKVKSHTLDLDESLLIQSVTFTHGENGSETTLELVRRGSFEPKPVIESEGGVKFVDIFK
ncbi:MAG: hypothetical protein COB04_16045 [Gammaproteobacteria bacterium]|nr:MAG: hypothetical protein COB04_16045 [Gammaproteobacteria bacterium]